MIKNRKKFIALPALILSLVFSAVLILIGLKTAATPTSYLVEASDVFTSEGNDFSPYLRKVFVARVPRFNGDQYLVYGNLSSNGKIEVLATFSRESRSTPFNESEFQLVQQTFRSAGFDLTQAYRLSATDVFPIHLKGVNGASFFGFFDLDGTFFLISSMTDRIDELSFYGDLD